MRRPAFRSRWIAWLIVMLSCVSSSASAESKGTWSDGDPERYGRYILIAGGEHDPLTGPDVELHSAAIYDAVRNKFIDVGPMPHIHDDHTESALPMNSSGNPEVLLFGGNSSNSSTGTSRFEFNVGSIREP